MKEKFIEFKNVCFNYKEKNVLNNVSFTLNKSTSYALIGQSGSGKTTILNLLAGFLTPTSGTVLCEGYPIPKNREGTSYLHQELGLFPWQRVIDAVKFPLKLKNKEIDESSIEFLLSSLRISDKKDKFPAMLSGGEKQRVALARTLATNPDLLLMDEPTSALDPMTKEEIQGMILAQHKSRETATVFVTHDIEEAVMLGEYILVLSHCGSLSIIENEFYMVENPKEKLGFYDQCIKLRELIKAEVKI